MIFKQMVIGSVGALMLSASAAMAVEAGVEGGAPYLTGGIGKAERDALMAQKKLYNFEVKVALKTGHYLGDVRVQISDKSGAMVLNEVTDGPLFFVKLEPGEYTVKAMYEQQERTQSFTISEGVPMREVIFRFEGNEEIVE